MTTEQTVQLLMEHASDLRMGQYNSQGQWTWLNVVSIQAMAMEYDLGDRSYVACDCKRVWEAFSFNRDLPHEIEQENFRRLLAR